ncbi:MAG TPA: apolipoprotein N-acyltransferase, partial [Bacteroidia bacterium]|nr:apolipoprotein N-acyltransferase [Bacteroidia bacterium]
DPQVQIEKTLKLVNENVKSFNEVDYLVFPETFLTSNMWENELSEVFEIQYLREKLITQNKELKIVSGANTLKLYEPNEKKSPTAHKFTQEEGYYDSYNSAIQIDSSKNVQVYRKSKLVPGSEIMPFLWLFKPLEKYALDLGGTVGSLGLQKERSVFKTNNIALAPIICYESVYPEYVTEYIKNGANMLFIVTNDGWWGDTPGYRQHLAYGALRAIETRKPIARSANTGTSCFVNEKGEVYHATSWWQPAIIKSTLSPNTYQTVFVKLGDVLAKASLMLAAFLFILSVYKRFAKR